MRQQMSCYPNRANITLTACVREVAHGATVLVEDASERRVRGRAVPGGAAQQGRRAGEGRWLSDAKLEERSYLEKLENQLQKSGESGRRLNG